MTDAELDAALGALTAIEIDPRMQARVLRAIETPSKPSVTGAVLPACTVLAAAAVVLLAVVTWRVESPPTLPPVGAPPGSATSAALAVPGMPGDVHVPVLVREAAVVRGASVERPWPYSMPAIERESPLAIDRIRHAPIAAPALGVEPLQIAGLEIDSLER